MPDESYSSIPLRDGGLLIWLERKMTRLRLNSGGTLRGDHVKLKPAGLAKIIGTADGVISPFEAIRCLLPELQDVDEVKTSKKPWKNGRGWKQVMALFGNAATIGRTVLAALFFLN